MKKTICFLLFLGTCFGLQAQELAPGVLLSVHTFTPELKTADATLEEFTELMQEQFVKTYSEKLPGMHMYLLEALRGECEDCLAYLVTADSEEVRDLYWNEDGSWTDLGEEKRHELMTGMEGFLEKYDWEETYTDWLVK